MRRITAKVPSGRPLIEWVYQPLVDAVEYMGWDRIRFFDSETEWGHQYFPEPNSFDLYGVLVYVPIAPGDEVAADFRYWLAETTEFVLKVGSRVYLKVPTACVMPYRFDDEPDVDGTAHIDGVDPAVESVGLGRWNFPVTVGVEEDIVPIVIPSQQAYSVEIRVPQPVAWDHPYKVRCFLYGQLKRSVM